MAEGAVVLAGGGQPSAARCPLFAESGGHFYEPTVLGEVRPAMSCFQVTRLVARPLEAAS